jgi:hypothetical protein
MLLTYVPKIERPTAQPGTFRPADMKPSLVRCFAPTRSPTPIVPEK